MYKELLYMIYFYSLLQFQCFLKVWTVLVNYKININLKTVSNLKFFCEKTVIRFHCEMFKVLVVNSILLCTYRLDNNLLDNFSICLLLLKCLSIIIPKKCLVSKIWIGVFASSKSKPNLLWEIRKKWKKRKIYWK